MNRPNEFMMSMRRSWPVFAGGILLEQLAKHHMWEIVVFASAPVLLMIIRQALYEHYLMIRGDETNREVR